MIVETLEKTQLFRDIAIGSVFYLSKYYGNVYRKIDERNAEFVAHRSNRSYIGCKITMGASCPVLRQPLSKNELEFLGMNPDDWDLLES